jgi:hypothetical protein
MFGICSRLTAVYFVLFNPINPAFDTVHQDDLKVGSNALAPRPTSPI